MGINHVTYLLQKLNEMMIHVKVQFLKVPGSYYVHYLSARLQIKRHVYTHGCLRTVPGTGSQITVRQMYITIINNYCLCICLSCYTANFQRQGLCPIYFCTSSPLWLNKLFNSV